MDQNNISGYRHRRPPSSDRLFTVFSPPSAVSSMPPPDAGDELSEIDVFYTSDGPEPPRSPAVVRRCRRAFASPEKFGILAALPEDGRIPEATVQKPLLPSQPAPLARDVPSIPKPHPLSEASRYSQSAPIRIPMMARKARDWEADAGEEDGGDEEVLPPHEIVARGSMRSQTTTFSVLEGVGRTLKGRDLRRVRNAVWRQTGFLD
ncbi:hypothetical protein STAS_09888 [Striga asiatica]|uniref:Senescence regulator n=1 Tax=Striga asiatica TaxID=4170 RepID=A0A5A7PLW5_STRAF|nr:hypothetical protein STAS_09888 [Striga asiatica]